MHYDNFRSQEYLDISRVGQRTKIAGGKRYEKMMDKLLAGETVVFETYKTCKGLLTMHESKLRGTTGKDNPPPKAFRKAVQQGLVSTRRVYLPDGSIELHVSLIAKPF